MYCICSNLLSAGELFEATSCGSAEQFGSYLCPGTRLESWSPSDCWFRSCSRGQWPTASASGGKRDLWEKQMKNLTDKTWSRKITKSPSVNSRIPSAKTKTFSNKLLPDNNNNSCWELAASCFVISKYEAPTCFSVHKLCLWKNVEVQLKRVF